jgi:pyruvate dehydrogenase E2 component (dihydrolipoamide acetyltransferase)
VSPYAKKLAGEKNIPLDQIEGTGPNNRIIAADVLEFKAQPQ